MRDNEIVWTSREVDATTVMRTRRIFCPSPVATSVFTFAGTLLKQNILDMAKFFGYQPAHPAQAPNAPSTAIVKRTLERLQQQATKQPDAIKGPGDITSPTSTASSRLNKASAGQPASPSTAENPDLTKPASPKDFYPYDRVRSNIDSAWVELRKKLAQKWRPLRDFPPRGCVLVTGLVELAGPRGYVVIDVSAWWDPKTRKYDSKSMWMGMRRLQMKHQAPQR